MAFRGDQQKKSQISCWTANGASLRAVDVSSCPANARRSLISVICWSNSHLLVTTIQYPVYKWSTLFMQVIKSPSNYEVTSKFSNTAGQLVKLSYLYHFTTPIGQGAVYVRANSHSRHPKRVVDETSTLIQFRVGRGGFISWKRLPNNLRKFHIHW